MKNNKGFTMIEVLAVIVIIGLIAGIGALAYTTLLRKSENRVYESYEKTMRAETINLIINHLELGPRNGETKRYSLSDIKIEPIKNPKKSSDLCSNSYVLVTRTDTSLGVDSYEYKVCLICDDYNSDSSVCQ